MSDFRRARQPDQIGLRRESLLKAAAALFDEEGPAGAGLTAIAARAGFTKSNVYRYFESREDVLLALFMEEWAQLDEEIERSVSTEQAGDTQALANTITGCFLARPRCCHLMSIFASVLEQNVSQGTIETVKRDLQVRGERIVRSLMERLPASTLEDCAWVFSTICALIAGMWPGAHPAPAAAAVLAKPEFAHMVVQPERDLQRAIAALLASISKRPDEATQQSLGPISAACEDPAGNIRATTRLP